MAKKEEKKDYNKIMETPEKRHKYVVGYIRGYRHAVAKKAAEKVHKAVVKGLLG